MNRASRLQAARTRSPLSWPDVRAIRRRLEAGETQREIAADYKVNSTAISAIGRNVSWHDPDWVRRPLVRDCKLESCGERFETTHAAQVYCVRQHYFEDRPNRLAQLMLTKLGTLIASSPDTFDEVEVRRLRLIVGDLDEVDVASMSEDQLAPLRRRLHAAGFGPATIAA